MAKRFIGIDLGTTNSTVSIANLTLRGDIESHTLEVTQVDETGNNMVQDPSLPSVLYIDDDLTPYVGRFAKRMHGLYPQNTIKEAKRYIGQDVTLPIRNTELRPEIVSSYVLKVLKAQAADYFGGETIDSAVITIPANFNFQQQQATKQAGVLSGFDKEKIHMIPEPTAALIDFLNEEKKLAPESRRLSLENGKKNLLVFDLGGGTCDVSILQVNESVNGGMDIQELSISQYTELGGVDFDSRIMNMLLMRILKPLGLNFKQFSEKYDRSTIMRLVADLTDFAEQAKKHFSTRIENQLRNQQIDYYENKELFDQIPYRRMISSQLPEELSVTLSITKKEYDAAIESLLYKEKSKQGKNIEEPILNALKFSKLGEMTVEDIDAVFLVGGMTFYHTIQDRIYEIFNRRIKPIKSINPMFAVSRGAAIYHQQIDKISISSSDQLQLTDTAISREDVVFTNTVPNNVYIDVFGANPVALLEKGTKLPFERIIEGQFIVTGPSNVKKVNAMQLELFSAMSPTALQTTHLKSAKIDFKKPVEVNSKLVLKVECNKEREVFVKAWLEDDETEVIDVNIGAHEFSEKELLSVKESQEKLNKIKA